MSHSHPDVAIIGAGPYGLSLAAHLKSRRVGFRIFGTPMLPWSRMHKGMGLKSPDFGTNVYAPKRGFRFVEWARERGISLAEPISIDLFTEYGRWAQEMLVPEVEQIDVTDVTADRGSFGVTLADGQSLSARRVVVATGLSYYARIPSELRDLPSDVVTHTTAHREYAQFAGRKVAVIGGGASALEAGVMLQEAGADVAVLVRGIGVYRGSLTHGKRRLRDKVLNPSSVLGPGRTQFLLERVPWAAHYIPVQRRVRFVKSFLGPAAGWWLGRRAESVPVRLETSIAEATVSPAGVQLRLRTGGSEYVQEFHHVVCGTGFEFNLDRLPFLDAAIKTSLGRIERAPALSRRFESSVRGLYFTGPAAAMSFGPLLRFVAGAEFATPLLARHLSRGAQRRAVAALSRVSEPA